MRAAIFILFTAALGAHEIGTTRVTATFHQGRTYEIAIVTDAATLAEKVRFDDGGAQFRRRVRVMFGGAEVTPSVAYSATGSQATVRLTGQVAPGAFTWSYGWTFASYAFTVHRDGETAAAQWLEGGQISVPSAVASPTAWRYLKLGYTHILPNGLDHMLFVLGIFLLSGRVRTILMQVSAFTVAHSITLGLSMYGLVSVSPKIVEPMIAVSIAYVAIENIFLKELKSWRVALVFGFGLLHGMGFAGALQDLGLPRSEFLTALLTFNIGVEAGQLSVIAIAFLAVGWTCAHRDWYRGRVVLPASAMIACTAVYWTVQRLAP
jgi:hydrogenase/urease accessory protein HupE